MNPLISVILPVYNGERFIAKAINSVLSQSCNNMELIIIDDNSNDSSEIIINRYTSIDERVRCFRKNIRGGAGAARNYGMGQARGDYFAFIDSDDLYVSCKLEKQIDFLSKNPQYGLVYNDVTFINENDEKMGAMHPDLYLKRKEDWRAYALFRQTIPAIATIMIRREIFDKGYRYCETTDYGEDVKFVFDISEEYSFGYINEELYCYRKHKNNITNNRIIAKREFEKWERSFDVKEIINIVNESNFSKQEKKILLANIFINIEKYSEALLCLENCENIYEKFSVMYLKGVCYFEIKKYNKALEAFEKSIELDPYKAEAYNNLACVKSMIGENGDDILILLNKALQLRENYMDATTNKTKIMEGRGADKLTQRELMKDLLLFSKE